MTHEDRIHEINVKITDELAAHNIEDTPENRFVAMKGLYDAWNEGRVQRDEAVAKAIWVTTLKTMLIEMIDIPWS